MARRWEPGDTITYKLLNELQKKADEYDRILPEYEALKEAAEAAEDKE